jgi:hypothetical protein
MKSAIWIHLGYGPKAQMNAHPSIPKVPARKIPCCIIIFHIKWPSYIILLHKLAPLSSTGFGETQDNSGTLEISRSWLGKTAAFLPCNGLASFPSASSTSKPWPIVAKLVPRAGVTLVQQGGVQRVGHQSTCDWNGRLKYAEIVSGILGEAI